MHEFDDAVLQCFLDNQEQLFPEGDVASNLEEAEAFLEDCIAVVVDSPDEVMEYLIPVLTIQTFVENSMKHAMKGDYLLNIKVLKP